MQMKRLLLKATVSVLAFSALCVLLTSCFLIGSFSNLKNCEHNYATSSTPPTCTTEGYTHYVCLLCSDSYSEATIPMLEHSFEAWSITLDPTWKTQGEKERRCTRCDFVETATVLAHQHDLSKVEAQPVGCYIEGWDEYKQCGRCEYNTKVIKEATGHEWGSVVSLGNGTHKRICLNDASHLEVSVCTYGNNNVCEICGGAYAFGVRHGNTTYGYDYFAKFGNLADGMQRLYRDFNATAESFYYSSEDVAQDEGYYIIGSYDLSDYNITMEAAEAVWVVFYISNPTYYWIDSTIVNTGDVVHLAISDDYSSAAYRRLCDAAILRMEEECGALITADMTDLEKTVTITSYIVKSFEYAYEKDGTTPVYDRWAHDMSGFAVHGYGVCEAYAKTFMYLCQKNGIDCIIGLGRTVEGGHAWNYFNLDGIWYGADLTWADDYGDEVFYDQFGLSYDTLFEKHFSDSSDALSIDFTYEPPKLSDTDLRLTALYKAGVYVGMYGSLTEALGDITDHDASYTVDIGFYSNGNDTRHVLDASVTPKVKSLTIRGRNVYNGEDYLDFNSLIEIKKSLSLGSDLELKDVHIAIPEGSENITLELETYNLTLSGNSVYIEARVKRREFNNPDFSINVQTHREVYFIGGANVFRISIRSAYATVIFGADSTVTHCTNRGIYTTNGAQVSIRYYTIFN